jgi:beta-galactosidase
LDVAVLSAFHHDLMRTCGDNKPFMLMECTPSLVNWKEVNKLKRPKQHLLASIQAIGHGSNSIQYFQFRKSRGSSEKFHGAVVDHCGHENTRVFKEVSEVGAVLKQLDCVLETRVKSDVAIIFDWENRWALSDCQGLKRATSEDPKKYLEVVLEHYKAFWQSGISVDIVSLEADFSKYKTVISPMTYMIPNQTGERLSKFVKNGGNLVATFCSGVVNENDLVHLGGLPGAGMGEVCGVWAEEIDTLWDGQKNLVKAFNKEFEATDYCEIIHAKTAEVLGSYTTDFYANTPAITKNKYGDGTAYYIAFRSNEDFLIEFYNYFMKEHNVRKNLNATLPYGVTATKRVGENGEFVFIQNFEDYEQVVTHIVGEYTYVLSGEKISAKIKLDGFGFKILK